MNLVTSLLLAAFLTPCILAQPAAEKNPFEAPVQPGRPRVFLRRENFDGLTVEKLRTAMQTPEYAGLRQKLIGKPSGRALLWMLDEKPDDLQAAIAGLKKMDASGGTWSDRGLALMQLSMLFDWLYEQLDEPTRQQTIAKIEKAADAAVAHITGGHAPYFYSRTPGALAGMTVAGIALSGVSAKADGYLKLFREWGVNDFFKSCEWTEGAMTGGLYSMFYNGVDLSAVCAAWWSATGQNPTGWIRQNQGDWLGKMVAFNRWYMRPGFAFTDINDTYREIWASHDQPDTATHVFFRCGDPMDVHGGVSAGEFQVFKFAPLAARSGRYQSYDSPPDQYHRNAISTNVVLFLDPDKPDDRGDQLTRRGLKDDHKTWKQWLEIRQRNSLDVAKILDWQVDQNQARCRADLSGANPKDKCSTWIRELVWLANKHLVVLDIVESPREQVRRLWQLHSVTAPTLGNRTITIANRPPDRKWADPRLKPQSEEATLTCQTLMPEKYTVILHSGGKAQAIDPAGNSAGAAAANSYHLKYGQSVIQLDPGHEDRRLIFLNVLTATGKGERQGGQATLKFLKPGQLQVTVDGSSAVMSVPEWVRSR